MSFLHIFLETHRRWCRALLVTGSHRNEESRIAAAKCLRDLRDPASIHCLIRVLGDRWVGKYAGDALVAIGPEAVQPLIAALKNPDHEVVISAVEVLGELKDVRALDALLEILRSPKPYDCSYDTARKLKFLDWTILRALSKLGDPSAADTIHTTLWKHDEKFMRDGVEVLGTLKSATSIPVLMGIVEQTDPRTKPHGAVSRARRRAAQTALAQFADPSARRAVDTMFGELVNDLESGNAEVRQEALGVLSRLQDSRVVEPLLAALADQDKDVKKAAAEALASCCRWFGADVLSRALSGADASARTWIVEKLRYSGDESATSVLVGAVRDAGDPEFRRKAVEALVEIGDPKAVDGYLTLLDDSDPGVRGWAIDGLSRTPDARALEPLIRLTRDPKHGVSAARALEEYGGMESSSTWRERIGELIRECANPADAERLRAVKQLSFLGRPIKEVKETLLHALRDTTMYEYEHSTDPEPVWSDTMGGGVIGTTSQSYYYEQPDIAIAALRGLERIYKGTGDEEIMNELLRLNYTSDRFLGGRLASALEVVSGLPFASKFEKSERQWRSRNRG